MKAWNSTLNVGTKPLKATKGLNRVSKKMAIQKRLETALKFELLKECDYKCQFCGNSVFTHRLDKHEIIPRGEGGNPLDKSNCILLCCFCHARCELDSTKPEKITREMLYEIKNKRRFVMSKENLCPLGEAGSREIPKHNIASNPNKDCPACQPELTAEMAKHFLKCYLGGENCQIPKIITCFDGGICKTCNEVLAYFKRIAGAK